MEYTNLFGATAKAVVDAYRPEKVTKEDNKKHTKKWMEHLCQVFMVCIIYHILAVIFDSQNVWCFRHEALAIYKFNMFIFKLLKFLLTHE